MSDAIHLFGIRHHGPGCARSLLQALHTLQPDCLLIEGPPDAEAVLPFVLSEAMQPPVALLVHAEGDPRQSAFYPFAEFSPEWQALRYALGQNIPTRFIDLPATHQFALEKAWREEQQAQAEAAEAVEASEGDETTEDDEAVVVELEAADFAEADGTAVGEEIPEHELTHDPLGWLGRAAGYADGESWWNHMVEERCDGEQLFAAIAEAMQALREQAPTERSPYYVRREALREAHMRKCLRQALKDGYQRIAVVCGAWHVPALATMPAAKLDNDLLKGLPKLKVAATWAPWTYRNLSSASGYGAGVDAPAWYAHLWNETDSSQRAVTWLARAARLFRDDGLDCSSAHIIEATRLADALAAMRERPAPGLEELFEALQTTVCMGDAAPMSLIRDRLIVGNRLGGVPSDVPAVPLQRDLEQLQKSLRMKPQAAQKTLDLDLRETGDLARSHLLHRLAILGIGWGELARTGVSAKGTFHEIWNLQWQPELAVSIIEASQWGSTVEDAASARAIGQAKDATSLPELSALVDTVLLANLPQAVEPVTHALEDLASVATDVAQLLDAVPALTRIARYGNVRQTDTGMVRHVLDGLIARAAIGLAPACASLDDDAAMAMRERIGKADAAIRLLDDAARSQDWQQALGRLAVFGATHGLLAGQAARLLFDAGVDDVDTSASRMTLALSRSVEPAAAAGWLEGFLDQSALILMHDPRLWTMVDGWLATLSKDHFDGIIALLRRTFSTFSAAERRELGERARRPVQDAAPVPVAARIDAQRAARPVPLLGRLLGLPHDGASS